MKKIGFAPMNLKQEITYDADPYYELNDWTAYKIYFPVQQLFPDEEQMFFALIGNGGEIILGMDFFFCEVNLEILMTYMFDHSEFLDEEASEYIVRAFLTSKIISEIRNYYKKKGYQHNGIRYWRRKPIVIDVDDYPV
jgi:hypothetical protein